MSQKEHDAVVVKRLHQILKNADLEKTTVKNIQKQLESDLQITLSDRKQFIRDEVRVVLPVVPVEPPCSDRFARSTAPRAPRIVTREVMSSRERLLSPAIFEC